MAATTAASPPLDGEPAQRDRLSRALGAAFLSHQVDSLQRSVEDMSFTRSSENPVRGMYRGPWGRGASTSPVQNAWPAAGRASPQSRGRGRGAPGRGYANAVTGQRTQTHREREREKQRQRQRDEDMEFDRSLPVPAPNAVVARVLAMPVPAPKQEVVDDREPELELEDQEELPGVIPQEPVHSSILSWRAEVARDMTLDAAPLDPAAQLTHDPDAAAPEPRGPAVPAGINPLSFQRRLADRIVLDASVLMHSLGTVRKWCGEGRREEVVVPLEALNTLDLLKKGSSPLAGSARAASRYLEDQVGLNPRITVQSEDAYIPWEQIPGTIPPALVPQPPAHARAASAESSPALGPLGTTTTTSLRPVNRADCPEWIKRTLCSAAFEFDTALHHGGRKAVLAVIAPQGDRLRGDEDTVRWEGRADGREVRAWALEQGVLLLELGKTPRAERERRSVDSDRERFESGASAGSRERGFGGRGRGRRRGAQGIVDKPVQELPRVVKVLARGERLDT
ncbi:hypothetical protein CALVIDRAFT_567846 [Calocera viscosa TUFC12733]|uniref:PIN domain-containing protein n=1 Tax=Calocera viscosa (strain TUFC12733) TaxID=1330018 RepID=A0A167HTI6_CALVF|nr:hypothetical protein CALVIDRAFT_567846 [Calocera viscosa TUFC12733]